MAEVTVYDAARMKAIEDATVVNGEIDVNGHLILTRFDTTTIDAGQVSFPPTDDPAYDVFAKHGLFKVAGVDLAAPAATIDFTAIPAVYDALEIHMHVRSNTIGGNYMYMNFNNDAADALYSTLTHVSYGSGTDSMTPHIGDSYSRQPFSISDPNAHADAWTNIIIRVPYYAEPAHKTYHIINDTSHISPTPATNNFVQKRVFGVWRNVAALNRVTFQPAAGSFVAGSKASIYGVKGAA